ncbi:MAG: radical SAM protein [Patescibacteria group bacterium]|nr:radical SAM protein [Patescibacteria group bacterium]
MYRKLSAPISVQVEITSNCNNNCIYCYNHWREYGKSLSTTLSTENLNFICEQLVIHQVFTVTITGGEPLLFWECLPEAIEKLEAANVGVSLNSNLTLLTPKIARALKASGLKTILTSILSNDEKIHDQLSNRTGAWEQTVQGIETAIAQGFNVSANMVLLKQNHKHIYSTAAFLKSLGVQSFSATKASPSLNSRNFDELRLNTEELRESLSVLETIKQDLSMSVDILECYPLCLLADLNRFSHFARRGCTAGITGCTIGADGDVRPCSHADLTYGNIFQTKLSDIFGAMDDWRDGKYVPKDCRQCSYFRMCSGGCRMEAKYLGDICGKDPYMTSKQEITPKSQSFNQPSALSQNQRYFLQPDLRWRVEEFGAVIGTNASSPLLINDDGLKIIRSLPRSGFTSAEIVQENDPNRENIERFLTTLLRTKFIVPVKVQ